MDEETQNIDEMDKNILINDPILLKKKHLFKKHTPFTVRSF